MLAQIFTRMKKYFEMKVCSLFYCLGLAVLSLGLGACGEMDDTYDDFIKNGTIAYTGRADSVKAYAGKERVKLAWLLMSDPKVTGTTVYWNNRKDSLAVAVSRSTAIDTVELVLTKAEHGIQEGAYIFDIYTYDKYGNRSVKVQKLANVYGSVYQSSLLPRPVSSLKRTGSKVVLGWYDGGEGSLGVELVYTDAAGTSQTVWVPASASTATLTNFKAGNAFRYRTLFLPEPMAIDTFYTDYTTVEVK